MNITEILERAMKEPTLLDALSVACIWEAERAIEQARENKYEGWETCFKHTIKLVFDEWEKGGFVPTVEAHNLVTARNVVLRSTVTKMRDRAKEIIGLHDEVVK